MSEAEPQSNAGWVSWRRAGAVGLVIGLLLVLCRPSRTPDLPTYGGRTLESWLREASLQTEFREDGSIDEALLLKARLAFLQAGTSAVPFLVREATSSRGDSLIRHLAKRLTRSLPAGMGRRLVVLNETRANCALGMLRMLQPEASQVMPLLGSTNVDLALVSGLGLLYMMPGHDAAFRTVERGMRLDKMRYSVGWNDDSRSVVCRFLLRLPPRRCDRLIPLIEPLARAGLEEWTGDPTHTPGVATRALERLAPERAQALYERAFRWRARAEIAARLLHLDRTRADATRFLVQQGGTNAGFRSTACLYLEEAASSNLLAIQALQDWEADRDNGHGVSAAAQALLLIRYRETRAALGLPPEDP